MTGSPGIAAYQSHHCRPRHICQRDTVCTSRLHSPLAHPTSHFILCVMDQGAGHLIPFLEISTATMHILDTPRKFRSLFRVQDRTVFLTLLPGFYFCQTPAASFDQRLLISNCLHQPVLSASTARDWASSRTSMFASAAGHSLPLGSLQAMAA